MAAPVLQIKNLQKKFGDKTVHHGVSLELRPGELLGLLGNSGTGKSVLLRCLIGLDVMDDGEVWFKGQRIDLLKEHQLSKIRTKLSYAFQSGALFDSLTVQENVAYPLREHLRLTEAEEGKRVREALTLVHMAEAEHLLPSDLSGGMQKRVGLARAVVLRPDVILYDEPTAGLDPVNVENVLEIMRDFKSRGMGGIFVTHDIPAARKVCDRLAILHEGRVGFEGDIAAFDASTSPIVEPFQSS